MCSKLYADGELAATPYETDKVLRHRELCMGRKDIWRILDRRRAKSDEYGNPAAACRV